jgi:three-Cys-motif partner protein
MANQKFGTRKHTGKKLDVLDKYHGFFPLALKTKGYRLIYIDAFAGTGEVLLTDSDAPLLPGLVPDREVIEGSAIRALRAAVPYDEYVFIEKSAKKLAALQTQLSGEFPQLISACRFVCADVNVAIKDICAATDWSKYRAVVFLDPFGNQIAWDTLEAIAQTQAADVWYLFPAGLGVHRQIPKKGKPQTKAAQSITKMLGSDDWVRLFTSETVTEDLFGEAKVDTQRADAASAKAITEHAISRLGTVFLGGVADQYVMLGGKEVAWYSLIFACSNPSIAAKTLAHKVAGWIIGRA